MAKWTPLFCGEGKFYTREQTRPVKVGRVQIGGGAPVSVQSMTTTKTEDIDATVAQIHRLEEAGCEIVRVAVPNEKAARALKQIKEQINIPLVADIHFDYRMALLAIEAGVDKIRWNPRQHPRQAEGGDDCQSVQGAGHSHPHRRQRRFS
jgi:(E)-4-hydroxy-3-methylbut-2-enyl-diphosphate synthase